MILTVLLSLSAGLAFRKRFQGSDLLFFVAIASLIVPSIVTSLGIALEFRLLDDFIKNHGPEWLAGDLKTTMGTFTSGLGAHLTWTLPFGLLVMFAIFNRFDARYEEAARDLGATPWQTLRFVILPIILPSVIGVGLFGFTLSWDEIARSSQAMGEHNTLPMELQALTTTVTTPEIYALGHRDHRRVVRRHRAGPVRDHADPRPPGPVRLRRRPGVRPAFQERRESAGGLTGPCILPTYLHFPTRGDGDEDDDQPGGEPGLQPGEARSQVRTRYHYGTRASCECVDVV